MLQHFSRIINCRSIYTAILISLSVFTFSNRSHAQSLGDPLVHITFGSGPSQYAGPLRADSGTTTYTYVNISPEDNFYTIANSTSGMNPGWVYTTDHTGDPSGYMMIVNASRTPGLFYTRTVPVLCGSTTYQFSAWIKNIIKSGGILPNVTFTIETPDGTVLGTGNTGNIPANNTWTEYPFTFTTPASLQTVVVKMINNAPGGSGNDLAIDDITFRPYGSTFTAAFNQANTSFCEGVPQTVNLKSITPLDANYAQKLQQLINGVWVDKTTGSTNTSFSIVTSPIPGSYYYRIVKSDASNIDNSNCVVSSNILTVTVVPLPTAAMLVPDNTCQGEATVFKDQSLAPNSAIVSWLWDFGDGQTSNQQNPSHIYATGGDYIVKLTVINKENCVPGVTSKKIHIIPQVNINFNYSTPDCVTRAITLSDLSTSTEGSIISRVWDFGDNTASETKTDNTPFQHTYASAGNYAVKLVITTDRGCLATLTKTIKVGALPVVDFTLPEVCYADLYAKFTDATTIPDNNTGGFTYLWNFGDADASDGNPNTSTLKNPQHYYGKSQQYQVTLTVTSAEGCSVSTTKTLQVNGSPVPDFEVLDDNSLCANREVFFVNKANATVGKISKIIWHFDLDDLSIQEVDNDPYPDKIYRHTYPRTGKSYKVRMEAFTGDADACHEIKETTINILPAPILSFTLPETVCLNAGTVQLIATDNTGSTGSATYFGTGVSGSSFDPATAGAGTFAIKCIYTSVNGCADTVTKNITVKPIPTVNAGPDVTILAGGSINLHATASGDNITYSWFPTTGLSNSTIADPVVTLNNGVTYTLTITNEQGCSVTDNVTVKVLQSPLIPNAFTPNNDGTNDTWDIKYLNSYEGCTVNVFNRNGQKVYTSIGYNIPWDGTSNGGNLPFGVYYYIIDPKHGRKQLSGYVTIIR